MSKVARSQRAFSVLREEPKKRGEEGELIPYPDDFFNYSPTRDHPKTKPIKIIQIGPKGKWDPIARLNLFIGFDPDFPGNPKPHGKQNKHHGRQPGSLKRKRDMVRKSRRANRACH